jgi:N-methyl-L-tryptophan oxidase
MWERESMPRAKEYEVIVVGAGSMGMAAGAFLAKQGAKTLLIDAFHPPHDRASHGGASRMIRHAYGEGKDYVVLAKRAQTLWEALETETGYKIFERTGVLGLGPNDSPFLQETIAAAKAYDLPLEVLSAREVAAKWPGIRVPDHFIGCYEPTTGFIYSENAIQAYKELALKNGAEFLPDAPVHSLDWQDGFVDVQTPAGSFRGEKVIITVGAWAGKLLSGLNLPLRPVRKVFGWFETPAGLYDAPTFPSFYVDGGDRMYYGFPNANASGLKLGRMDGGQPIDPDRHRQDFGAFASDEADLRAFLQTYMPQADGPLIAGKTCLMTHSPDSHFIIDRHPENENIVIACGFSGHGFKFASALGELLAQLALTGRTDHDISRFSLSRFNTKKAVG